MLTDAIIKKAKGKDKPYKLSDKGKKSDGRSHGGGLCLLVYPNGGKYWRYRYRFEGKAKMISLGAWPEITVEEARKRLAEVRTTKAMGKDPSKERQAVKQEEVAQRENTFEAIAREWHEMKMRNRSKNYTLYTLRRLETYVFPYLGNRPIKDIKSLEFLDVLRKIEARETPSVVKLCRQVSGRVFRYAIVTERAEYDITAGINDALQTSPPTKHHYSLDYHELPEFMADLKKHHNTPSVKLALRLVPLVFVRSKELLGATWDEIHWEARLWRIPGERMKRRREHIVPLSDQAMHIITCLKEINGHTPYLFPSIRKPDKTIAASTLLTALYEMGYHSRATAHGFRRTAATALREMGFKSEYIEMQLAHALKDKTEEAYNAAEYLPFRRPMMQHWSDFIDAASKEGCKIIITDFMVKQ